MKEFFQMIHAPLTGVLLGNVIGYYIGGSLPPLLVLLFLDISAICVALLVGFLIINYLDNMEFSKQQPSFDFETPTTGTTPTSEANTIQNEQE